MAQLKERSKNKWMVRIFLGRKDGKVRYHSKLVTGLKKDALAYARDIETKRDLGILNPGESLTLNQFLDRWLKDVKANKVKARTLEDYRETLKRYVKDELGPYKLVDLTPSDIQNFYNRLADQGLGRAVQYTHSILCQALKHAVWLGYIPKNPSEFTTRPNPSRDDIEILTPEQAKDFITALQGDRYYALFLLAISMGLRPSEYTALQWPDIDFKANKVSITRTVLFPRKGGGWYFSEPKTKNSYRTLPLPPTVVAALHIHKRKQAEIRLKAGKRWQNHDLVFCTRDGAPYAQRNLNRDLQPILDRAKITQRLTIYCLRHTYATLALAAGIDAKIVSDTLGHASVAFTQDTYQHVIQSMREGARDTIEAILFQQRAV